MLPVAPGRTSEISPSGNSHPVNVSDCLRDFQKVGFAQVAGSSKRASSAKQILVLNSKQPIATNAVYRQI
jgi:hypothetical protein